MSGVWATRRAVGAADDAAVRAVNLAAFPTALEADIADALRADGDLVGAWLALASPTGETVGPQPEAGSGRHEASPLTPAGAEFGGVPVGVAVLSRCWVGAVPVLALGPCAVLPAYQRRGAGGAAIRAALATVGETPVIVLGHAAYYPRFGFVPASRHGIRAPFPVPDENLMVLAGGGSVPSGTVRWAPAFGG